MSAAPVLEPARILTALRGGLATLGALDARLGGVDREQLTWALDDLAERGLVARSGGEDCGPDGICSTSAPLLVQLTDAGRASVSAAA